MVGVGAAGCGGVAVAPWDGGTKAAPGRIKGWFAVPGGRTFGCCCAGPAWAF